jgi:TonB family protein
MVSRQEIHTMPTARSSRLAGVILLLAAASAAAETYGYALTQGIHLTTDAAQQIEASLHTNPGDLFARTRLLGYYSAHAAQDSAMREARLRQIEWFIANAPACPVLYEPAARLQPADFAAPYAGYEETLRHAWQQQVDAKPDDARVTENAYRSLGAVDARENTAEKSVPFLKRLRVLDPGEPQWAADLASLYGFALLRGAAPGAAPAAKRFQAAVAADLEKSNDAAVVGYVGIVIYDGTLMYPAQESPERTAFLTLGEKLLRRAAELNPKNPGWSRVLSAPPPKTIAEFAALITGTLSASDLWRGGEVREMAVPPGAVRVASDKLRLQGATAAGRNIVTPVDIRPIPQGAIGAGCSVQFGVLVAANGRVERVEVAGFDRLNLPFEESERDSLRELNYQPTLVNGNPVEAVARFERKCPPSTAGTVTGVAGGIRGGVAGGATGGVPSGMIGSIPPPPPPPRRQAAGEPSVSFSGKVMAGQIVTKVEPVYPPVAKNARVQGVVRLSVIIDQEGKVESIERIDGHPLLTSAAIDAVKQWVYKPAQIDGKPVRVKTEVDVTFTLNTGQ